MTKLEGISFLYTDISPETVYSLGLHAIEMQTCSQTQYNYN